MLVTSLLVTPAQAASAHASWNMEPSAKHTDSLRIMVGQMVLVGFRGMMVDENSSIYGDIAQRGIGGVILFDYDVPSKTPDRNIESPTQVAKLTAQLQAWASIPLLIAIDQEGGRVNRLKERFGFPKSVSAGYLGTIDDPDSTRFYAERTASTLASAGINLNFAPVVDLNTNPSNPIIGGIERSFSADPKAVATHAAIVVRAHLGRGVATALKHFPGHGSSAGDTHLGLVDVSETWVDEELLPYRMLIDSSLVFGVMTAHVVNRKLDPEGVSSTLSKPVISGTLRGEMGYSGVVYSDDLQMGAIRDHYDLPTVVAAAVQAGVDVLTFANNSVYEPDIAERAIGIILDLVEQGEVTRSRIRQSYERIMRLKAGLIQQ